MDSGMIIAAATIVYTALTAMICVSNYKAALAAKKQTEELVRQRESSQRPHIQIYLEVVHGSLFCFVVCNDGKTAAECVKVRLCEDFIAAVPDGYRGSLSQMNESELYLAPGQKLWIAVGPATMFEALSAKTASFSVSYGPGDYFERVDIDIGQYGFLLVHEDGEREIAKVIGKLASQQKKDFDSLKKAIDAGLSKPAYVTVVDYDSHQRNKLAVLNAISSNHSITPQEISDLTGEGIDEVKDCITELACTDRVIGSYMGTDYSNPEDDSVWYRK